MNKSIEAFARKTIKENLLKCTEAQQLMFKRMYSYDDLTRDIDSIVETLSEKRLNHALTQIQNTLKLNATKK